MNFSRNNRKTGQAAAPPKAARDYDRAAIIRRSGDFVFRYADALTGVIVFGATGSGKSSGPADFLARGYLAHNFGGLVLCAKPDERQQWEKWAAATGRSDDLIIVDKSGLQRFNFLSWEQQRPGEGGGLTMNITAMLAEIGKAVSGSNGSAGSDSEFFTSARDHMVSAAVDLCTFSGQPVSLPLINEIITSAPQMPEDVESERWQETSECWKLMLRAHARKAEMNAQEVADLTETVTYWSRQFPRISLKTRSIVVLMWSVLSRPFTTRPLRRLFSEDSTTGPEDCFRGKVIVIDLSMQEFGLAGRFAAMAWKYCFQLAVMRRAKQEGADLRPVFLWADECQNFVSDKDAEYQAVARSAGGSTVYLTQNRESLRRVMGSNDTVDALLGNLQCKFFCQNSGETNEYAARLLGERWTNISHSGYSFGGSGGGGHTETAEQRRFFVEPTTLAVLKRGGKVNGYTVEAVVYNGGAQYDQINPATGRPEKVPYVLLTLPQENPQ